MADGILTPCNVAQSWHWFRQVTAPCNVAGGSGMTRHWIRPYVRHSLLEFYIWFRFWPHHRSWQLSFCTSLQTFIEIGPPLAEKNNVMSILKMADLSYLGFYGSNNGFFEKPNYNLLNCLVFQKIKFLHFGVNIQDGGSLPSWILGVQ